jgi:hypothetical protein
MSDGNFIESEEHLRERNDWLRDNADAVKPFLGAPLECVVFVYSDQELGDRGSTRYGGQPYWLDGQPWPVCRSCSLVRPQLMQFVGQLDFRPSGADVPGDVLVFHLCPSCQPLEADGDAAEVNNIEGFRQRSGMSTPDLTPGLEYAPHTGWALTWQKVTDAKLIDSVPEADGERWGPLYGTPRNAVDYPTPPEAYGGGIAGEEYTYLNFTLQGTKIGGYRHRVQQTDSPLDSGGHEMHFLASMGSINEQGDSSEVMWGDMGSVFFWMSRTASGVETSWFTESF